MRVVIVGGGAIGLASAVALALGGHQVTVLDPSPMQGASWAAAGMLAPVSESSFGEIELTTLNVAAVADFTAFAEQLGVPVGVRTEGTLVVAFNADDKAEVDRLSDYRDSLGLPTIRLTGRQVRQHEPYLAGDVRAGVLARDDLSVDNRRYLRALSEAAGRAGVSVVAERATELSGGLVRAESGAEFAGDVTVLCAGAAAGALADLPVVPVKGQILRLAVPARLGPVLTRTVRGLVRGRDVYLVPRANGEIVVGATSEQQGFDTTVTAGGVYELLRNAYELLPISSEFGFVEARAGSRPGTPDNGPLLGWLGPGLLVATGHYRNGILLSASTAQAVAALVAGNEVRAEWKPFDVQRFAGSGRAPSTDEK